MKKGKKVFTTATTKARLYLQQLFRKKLVVTTNGIFETGMRGLITGKCIFLRIFGIMHPLDIVRKK